MVPPAGVTGLRSRCSSVATVAASLLAGKVMSSDAVVLVPRRALGQVEGRRARGGDLIERDFLRPIARQHRSMF